MMDVRIIKSDEQHREYQAEVERLAALDPEPDSNAGARLELLAKLVEDYEKTRFVFDKPDPINAILFRMDEQGLRQKDIADLLGGKNRASEVLAGKRPLTLAMIRSLYEKLDIPPVALIRETAAKYHADSEVTVEDLPLNLLVKRRWIDSVDAAPGFLQRLIAPASSPVFLKNTLLFGASNRTNRTNLWLWLAYVREIADARTYVQGRFKKEDLNEEMIRYVTRLSWMDKGPRLAKEFLEERGIALVVLPHLPGTHLDGAAMLGSSGAPVIGITLREDRLDNFWFTLTHELVHAWKHLTGKAHRAIVDENIESKDPDAAAIEKEANDCAAEILLPKAIWRRSEAYLSPSVKSIEALAAKLQISPAVVAGRLRHERQNYSLFAKLVGYRQARLNFPEVHWS